MAKKSDISGGVTPTQPVTVPQDLYATSDIRFVIAEVSKVGTKIDRLITDVGGLSERISKIEHSFTQVKVGIAVAIVMLTIFGGVLWWLFGPAMAGVRDGIIHAPPASTATPQTTQP